MWMEVARPLLNISSDTAPRISALVLISFTATSNPSSARRRAMAFPIP
jgi:hypothetical protein